MRRNSLLLLLLWLLLPTAHAAMPPPAPLPRASPLAQAASCQAWASLAYTVAQDAAGQVPLPITLERLAAHFAGHAAASAKAARLARLVYAAERRLSPEAVREAVASGCGG